MMRIIAGSARGRRLLAPGRRLGGLVRPTSDRAREALFNILAGEVAGARVLDLFAGTGGLGLEALSRGAAEAVFVEQSGVVLTLLERNLECCGFSGRARLVRRDISRGLGFLHRLAPAEGFNLVFVDPPYGRGLATRTLAALAAAELLAPAPLVVVEAGASEELPARAGGLSLVDSRRYGAAAFRFYRHRRAEGAGRSAGGGEP